MESERRQIQLMPKLALCVAAVLLMDCKSKPADQAKENASSAKPATVAVASNPVQGPAEPPVSVLPSAIPKPDSAFDFELPVETVTKLAAPLSSFRGKPLIIYYFSATCPHCQHSYPHVLEMAKELRNQGVNTIAIASASNRGEEIQSFLKERKNVLPVYKDAGKQLSTKYGTGYVPLVLVVSAQGAYKRFDTFDEGKTPEEVKALLAHWKR